MTAPPGDDAFERARAHFTAGLAALGADRLADAEAAFQASLALLPQRVSTLVNLAAVQVRLQRPQAALATVAQILAAEPGNAEAVLHRATAQAQLGARDAALADYDRVLALHPEHADAWTHRGSLLRELGRTGEAAESFARAAGLGADADLHAYYLAAVGAGAPPPVAPAQYVQTLFDGYAESFDDHLVGQLGYRGPGLLLERLPVDAHWARVLDAGCGTGLCGPLLRPRAGHLAGIDLSPAMLAQAAARGVYDALLQADIATHLQGGAAGAYGLVVAADVFIYVGDLAAVFAGARHALAPGGLLCFSAERSVGGDDGFALQPSLRYAHGERYLRGLAAAHGFEVQLLDAAAVRSDGAVDVPGWVAVLRRA